MSESSSDGTKSNTAANPTPTAQSYSTVDIGDTQSKGTNRGTPQENTEKEILDRVKAGERWMIWLTVVVAATAIFQTIQSCNNSNSTTQQTEQLIAAAKISAYAANQNVQASRNFAESARGINEGVSEAVDKLNKQAQNSAQQIADD